MKKIILITVLLLSFINIYSQKQYFDIGNTRIKDSVGYTTFNRPVLINKDLFVKGQIKFDSLGLGRMYYAGTGMYISNEKDNGGITITLGNFAGARLFIDKLLPTFPGIQTLMVIDSTGIDLQDGNMAYKILGVPISGGSTNLFGYHHKDTIFTANQHVKLITFGLRGSTASDSATFFVQSIADGGLIINTTDNKVTLGSVAEIGDENIYAGEYYRGSTLLTTYFNTNTTFSNIPYLDKTNTFTARNTFNVGDSAIITHSIKGLTGQTSLTIKSPGNGGQQLILSNTLTAEQIALVTNGGYSLVLNTSGITVNDARINWSSSGYSFGTDTDSEFKRNSADNVGIYTGGTQRLNISNSSVIASVPFTISGTTTYFIPSKLTTTQRDALTPVDGMFIFNTTTNTFQGYYSATWNDL